MANDIEATAGERPDFSGPKPTDSTELPPHIAEKRRINFADEAPSSIGQTPIRPSMNRASSSYSVGSVRSSRSRMRTVDPAVALPIAYRTISYNLEDGERVARAQAKAKEEKEKVTQEISGAQWHTMTHMELYKHFGSDPGTGLTSNSVKEKLVEFGHNVPSKPPSHLLSKIFWYFFGGFGSILLISSILVWICWKPLGNPNPQVANLALAIVLLAVFFMQAAFNAWQDFSSSRVMNSISGMLPEDCYVLRDGTEQMLQAPDVVPGDILYFKAGNKLPADVRFLDVSTDAKFDRSILTGESLPLAAVTESTDPNYLETRCIGMQGTVCTSGSGRGIVVSTGDSTVFGHIAKLTSTPNTESTPLQKEVFRFVMLIVSLMVAMDLIIIGVYLGYIRKKHPDDLTTSAFIVELVSIAVAFVPEGLPIALTASLTIIANIMRQNNILCKSLKTVETLGAVSVLLSDKTGTLTKNQMVVTDCWIGMTIMTMKEAIDEYGESRPPPAGFHKPALDQLRTVAAVCNAGQFDPTTKHLPLEQRNIIADATDQAILRMSESLAPVCTARGMWRKRFDLAFNSKNKFAIRVASAAEHEAQTIALSEHEAREFQDDRDFVLMIKGAPDVLIGRCSKYVGGDGNIYELDGNTRTNLESVKDAWSRQGKRCLLLARKCINGAGLKHQPDHGDFEEEAMSIARSDLILVGLVGIVDPPRDEIPDVIGTLRRAGIRTMMVTGDFKLTAQAIARMCNIISVPDEEVDCVEDLPDALDKPKQESSESLESARARKAIVLSGPELIHLGEPQWEALTRYQEIVFARTTPDQKLRIVKEFKAREYIVAMTGDGVNDAPSLKEADIGIAPGSGSDIAIEAADMVLLDSFSAIVQAVLYGRVVYDNLKKTIAYLLPAGSFSEFWPVMTSIIFGLPQILSSFLMIVICCFTDCAAATVLAYEKPEADVLLRPPRDVKKDKLVDWKLLLQAYGLFGMLETICAFSMSYWWLDIHGVPFSGLWWKFNDWKPSTLPPGVTVQDRLNTASSIYFITLVVMQWFTLMAIRTRRLSIFQHPPLFNKATQNWLLFPAILFALGFAFLWNYIPGLHSTVGSGDIPVAHWFLPFAFGFAVLCIDEGRKAAARRWPKGFIAKISW